MAKKDAKKGVAPVKPAGALATAVAAANDKVAEVHQAEHSWRLDLLKENETLSRETVDTEVEIRRLQNEQESLTARLKELSAQRGKAAKAVEELTKQVSDLEKARDLAEARRSDLEAQAKQLDRVVKDLDRDNGALARDNAKLDKQREKLVEDVDRLKKLKTDYLSAINKFKGEKTDLLK
jgi:chromosome segregation ATPase